MVAGCESKAGAAGFVGSQSIATSQLTGLVDRGVVAAQDSQGTVGRSAVTQLWLQGLIEVQLAQRVAAEQGVTVSPTDTTVFVNRYAPFNNGIVELQHMAAQVGIAAGDLPTFLQAYALENQIADRVAPTLLAPDSDARQAFEQLKGSYPGETYDDLAPQIRQLLVLNERRSAVLPLLVKEAQRIGVRVSPRFGSWNVAQLSIGAPPTDLARPATPSATPTVAPSADSSGETDQVPTP
jgi:hypothetical protein